MPKEDVISRAAKKDKDLINESVKIQIRKMTDGVSKITSLKI